MPGKAPPVATKLSTMRRVGVIGLGRIGMSVCARLVAARFDVVCTDLEPGRRVIAEATGASWRRDVAAVAAGVEVAVTVLPGPAEVTAVIDAVSGSLPAGGVWLDLSTASPAVARRIAAAAAARDVAVVDAPIGGGPADARDGTLLSFAGAAEGDLDRVRDVLAAFTRAVVHVGPHGSGYTLKLIANALWFEQAVATAEVLAIAVRAGLDPDTVQRALAQSAAGRGFVADEARALLAGDAMPSFALARCAAQLRTLDELAGELAVPADVLAAVARVHSDAVARYGDVDGELLGARFAAERAGVQLGA
jgi:3-hydroxyisobutyrate dehydrogenase